MNYNDINNKIFALQSKGLEIFTIGYSLLGRPIYATHTGSYNGPQVVIQGGIHAREYLSSLLVIEQASAYADRQSSYGGIYFVFVTDPDGVALVLDGIDSVECNVTKNFLISANNGNSDFSLYKANANAVDINTNFDAAWGTGSQNVRCPSSGNFIGYYANSERETQTLIDFTMRNKPNLTISYHTKGEVIYWGYPTMEELDRYRDEQIVDLFAQSTGYSPIFTESSSGGYKDWCIINLKIPSFTIEIGPLSATHPLGEEYLSSALEQNMEIPAIALQQALILDNN